MYNFKICNGIRNEKKFVTVLNNKSVSEMNPMFFSLLCYLYPNIKKSDIVHCYQNNDLDKADIFIEINNVFKQVSIKMGMKNSVHVERISDFIHFLIENHISKEAVIAYLKYHYADGTTNGKGTVRLSADDYRKNHQDSVDKINRELNQEDILNKVVDRFILKGRTNVSDVDVLIYGTPDDFLWICKDDIKKIIIDKKNIYSKAVHFGPLTCQPLDRCLNYNPKYESKRFCVQIKWYCLFDNILEIMNSNYQNNKQNRADT